ncbi:pyridoxamine 5'-phosphate oxidase family protein [Paenibacillus dokdonensis]|uniref:Pyridoxamine 5'-phosphate oxidase family protein n=1 Tax=Paenibacillus dokdonensis TaxID=2567944 RepID=A0ABU6GWW8_9BACL|nr:pyridoxamine 5'-phosphate oxidase family protein [Paenibacillus dokdonensis]MEC0244179.1 pyridoxamine 5'-phosphate oxidase family protein [Paenibacillus dokdonensis]
MSKFKDIIQSEEELEQLAGRPGELANNKVIAALDHNCRQFIALSPLVFISTSDAGGECDCSPRGDAPGFAYILDDQHLILPERPGNRRYDSLRNLLTNPHIGLIFVIPGLEETLRINGRGYVIRDMDLMERMSAQGKVPAAGIGIEVEECYIHCAKALKRSKLWQPDSWPARESLPDPASIIAEHAGRLRLSTREVRASLTESYEKRLY